MRTTRRCSSLRLNVGPNEPPKPSRAKQGIQFPEAILVLYRWQKQHHKGPAAKGTWLRGQRRIYNTLKSFGPLHKRTTARLLRILAPKQLVGDVQGSQHRQ